LLLSIFPLICIITILIFGLDDIINGYINILKHPGILITDYFAVGGFYSALLNMATISIINLLIIYFFNIDINGLIFAAYFLCIGFSAFGKTIINIFPIYLGGYIYSKYENRSFKSIFAIVMFSSGLAPLVSFILFNTHLDFNFRIVLGILIGIVVGIFIPPLSSHMLNFHSGYNLYNIGFTAGILGNIFAAIIRGQNIPIENYYTISLEYSFQLKLLLVIIFTIYIFIGYFINRYSFAGYDTLIANSGRLINDFILTEGFGISLINASVLGLLSIAFTVLINVPLNGALIAGIFSVFGFGALGKHPFNCIPVVIGVIIGNYLSIKEFSAFHVALTGLFSTTLSPISGVYGPFAGVIAGILHFFVVSNVGVIHGGFNLYNNGFSGGLVAGVLVPLLNKFKEGIFERHYKKNN
jgi:MFS family permease